VHPPGSGTTALHLAAALGRVDIVNLLLEQDSINDTLRDAQGRSVKDVARSKDVVRALQGPSLLYQLSYKFTHFLLLQTLTHFSMRLIGPCYDHMSSPRTHLHLHLHFCIFSSPLASVL
jgi:oxysterol-binding protein 1